MNPPPPPAPGLPPHLVAAAMHLFAGLCFLIGLLLWHGPMMLFGCLVMWAADAARDSS